MTINHANNDWWEKTPLQGLSQGELLPSCRVPIIPPNLDPLGINIPLFPLIAVRLIVVTQGCDLDKQLENVLLCRVHTLSEFADANHRYKKRKEYNGIRKGQIEGLHLLMEPPDPNTYTDRILVSFLEIYALPRQYVERHAASFAYRWRLKSPFLEHFSHAYGRLYSRVALPPGSEIPTFT
jgi:hypothetical protein